MPAPRRWWAGRVTSWLRTVPEGVHYNFLLLMLRMSPLKWIRVDASAVLISTKIGLDEEDIRFTARDEFLRIRSRQRAA